jgi:hypothetical protein
MLFACLLRSNIGKFIAVFWWFVASVVFTLEGTIELPEMVVNLIFIPAALAPLSYMLLSNVNLVSEILFRTFEGWYLLSLCTSTTLGLAFLSRYKASQIFWSFTSLTWTTTLDAAPPFLFYSPICYYVIFFASGLCFMLSVRWTLAESTRGMVLPASQIYIPGIGTMSMFQRFAITPVFTMGYFYFKYTIMKRSNLMRTNVLRCSIKEQNFESLQHLKTALQGEANMIIRSAESRKKANGGKEVKYFTLLSPFQPAMIMPNDTFALRVLGLRTSEAFR